MSQVDTNSTSPQTFREFARGRWVIDPARSSVTFAQRAYWGLATVRGTFTAVSGEGVLLSDGDGSGALHVEAASVNTSIAKRDVHLRSADYFDVANYPTIDFVADRVELSADATVVHVGGYLTVRGTTRPLILTAHIAAASSATIQITTDVTLMRKEFGIVANKLGMVKELTKLTVTAYFTRPQQ